MSITSFIAQLISPSLFPGFGLEAARQPPPRRRVNMAPHRSKFDRREAQQGADTRFRY